MKGIEKYAKDGKGSVLKNHAPANTRKADARGKSTVGPMSMRGNERTNGHARTSFSGAVVSGKHKANS